MSVAGYSVERPVSIYSLTIVTNIEDRT